MRRSNIGRTSVARERPPQPLPQSGRGDQSGRGAWRSAAIFTRPSYVPRVSAEHERTIFLLTREARQERRGFTLVYWGSSRQGPVRVRLTDRRALFFVEREVATRAGERSPTGLV